MVAGEFVFTDRNGHSYPRLKYDEHFYAGSFWWCKQPDGTYRREFHRHGEGRFRSTPVPLMGKFRNTVHWFHFPKHVFSEYVNRYDEQYYSDDSDEMCQFQSRPKRFNCLCFICCDGKNSHKTSVRSWKRTKVRKQWMRGLK